MKAVEIIIKPRDGQPETIPEKKGPNHLLDNATGKNNKSHRQQIQFIIRFLNKNKSSITKSYEQWTQVGYAIANTFTYEVGEKYFVRFSKLDKKLIKVNKRRKSKSRFLLKDTEKTKLTILANSYRNLEWQ